MSRYLVILNFRTFIALLISFIIPFISYRLNVSYDIDLTLISIAIIFPLVFTIRGAFRRREKALEHLSLFRASLETVKNLILSSKLETEDENKGIELVHKTNLDLFYFLRFMTYEHPTATPKSKSTVRVTSVNVRTPVQNGTTSNFTNGIVFTYGSCYGYFTVTSEQTSAL